MGSKSLSGVQYIMPFHPSIFCPQPLISHFYILFRGFVCWLAESLPSTGRPFLHIQPRSINDHSKPIALMSTPPVSKLGSQGYMTLAAELEYKELPAPPPPSPELRSTQTYQPIDKSILPSTGDFGLPRQRSYTTSEAEAPRHVVAVRHSALKNSPLRQVNSQVDPDANRKQRTPNHKRQLGGSLTCKSPQNRRATMSSPTGKQRTSSISSSEGVSKASSRRASPAFNMTYLRSTIHAIPMTTRTSASSQSRSPFEVSPRPSLRGRQISSPIMFEQRSSPTYFSSPRPVTPNSTSQSRSASFSTQSSELSQSDDLVSYFSTDTEDEEDGKGSKTPSSSKKGSLDRRGGQGGRFRRRLSEKTFAFFTCGKD